MDDLYYLGKKGMPKGIMVSFSDTDTNYNDDKLTIEAIFEKNRPNFKISRFNSIPLHNHHQKIDSSNSFYRVNTSQDAYKNKFDLNWINISNKLYKEYKTNPSNYILEKIEKNSLEYWKGKPFPESEPLWEFRSKSAVILDEIKLNKINFNKSDFVNFNKSVKLMIDKVNYAKSLLQQELLLEKMELEFSSGKLSISEVMMVNKKLNESLSTKREKLKSLGARLIDTSITFECNNRDQAKEIERVVINKFPDDSILKIEDNAVHVFISSELAKDFIREAKIINTDFEIFSTEIKREHQYIKDIKDKSDALAFINKSSIIDRALNNNNNITLAL